jgi:hypothetical protein
VRRHVIGNVTLSMTLPLATVHTCDLTECVAFATISQANRQPCGPVE